MERLKEKRENNNRKMKILFIHPDISRRDVPNLAIAQLSACLKEKGHETGIVDLTFGGNFNTIKTKIINYKPDIIAFSSKTAEFPYHLKLANRIKDFFEIPIIFGGVHPTTVPEEVIKYKSIDFICVGEGDLAFPELVESLKKREEPNIKGIWTKKNKNSFPQLTDLNVIPFMDRDIFDFEKYLKVTDGNIDIIAGRGCVFSCTYCQNNFINKKYNGKYHRIRKPTKVIEELEMLKSKYNVKTFHFHDDTFTINSKWIEEFCKLYLQKIKVPFICHVRPETLSDKVCNSLKKAGCLFLRMGIEHGNEEYRKNILKRFYTNNQIIKAFENAKAHGLKTYTYNMVGLPNETKELHNETIKLNSLLQPDSTSISTFVPFPNTELYDRCISKGLINKRTNISMSYKDKSILKNPYLTKNEIRKLERNFRFKVLKNYTFKKSLYFLIVDHTRFIYKKIFNFVPLTLRKNIYKFYKRLRK